MIHGITTHRVSSFSSGNEGGNPAGVVLPKVSLPDETMQEIAKANNFSETAFAFETETPSTWRVRYFAPAMEVPFCGHATIALGAVLAREVGPGAYDLQLNDGQISVAAHQEGALFAATLESPATSHRSLGETDLTALLDLFGYKRTDLAKSIPPALIHAGAQHVVLPLASREALAGMVYDFEAGKALMEAMGLVTVLFANQESDQVYHVRNAFAAGGVVEDPATGAAAAAFAGYLRDTGLSEARHLTLYQGQDMAVPSVLNVDSSGEAGSPIKVGGTVRWL